MSLTVRWLLAPIAALCFLVPAPVWPQEASPNRVFRSSFGMDWGTQWIWGDTLIPAGGRPGSGNRIDLWTDLGMDQSEDMSVYFNASLYDAHMLNLSFLYFSPSGSRTLNRTIIFQNRTYRPETRIDSKVDMNWSRLLYGYRIVDFGYMWMAPKLGAHYVRNTITLNGDTQEEGIISNTRSLDGLYPVLGFETRYRLPYGLDFSWEFEGDYLFGRGYITMTQLGARWQIHPEMALTLNSTHRAIQYRENNQPLNNEWTYSLLGWSAGVLFLF